MLKGMMKALKYGMALCMAVSLSAYIPEIGIQEVKATEVTASAEEKWSGTVSATPPKNDGNTYHIYTGEELAWVAQQTREGISFEGKTILLEDDINLNGQEWMPIGTADVPFKGIFDGAGKNIHGLMSSGKKANTQLASLFGYIDSAIIKDFKIIEPEIFIDKKVSDDAVSAAVIAAYSKNSRIENLCVKNASVTNKAISSSANSTAAGLIAQADNTIVSSISVSGTISGYDQIGGIFGRVADSTILNSLVSGAVIVLNNGLATEYADSAAGGLTGSIYNSKILNCYSQTNIQSNEENFTYNLGLLIGRAVKLPNDTYLPSSTLDNVYAIGDIAAASKSNLGGLIGQIDSDSSITIGSRLSVFWQRSDNGWVNGDATIPIENQKAIGLGDKSNVNIDIPGSNTSDLQSTMMVNNLNENRKKYPDYILKDWQYHTSAFADFAIDPVTGIDLYPVYKAEDGSYVYYLHSSKENEIKTSLFPYDAFRTDSISWVIKNDDGSDNTTGITVNNGIINGNHAAVGTTAQLIVTCGSISETVKLIVISDDSADKIKINYPGELLTGNSKLLTVTAHPTYADRSNIRWYIDNNPDGKEELVSENQIAEINEMTGLLLAKGHGKVKVVAIAEGTLIRDDYLINIEDIVWDGISSKQPELISGVYHIRTASELKWIADSTNKGNTFENQSIVLDKNIDLNGNNNISWIPIGSQPGTYFAGNFDGQGNTISNLYIDGSKYSDHDSTLYGLFGWLNNASISNLTLNNSVIINGTSDSFAGALAGQAQDSIITNASSKNAAIVSEGLTGGLIGYAQYNTIIANSTTQNLSAKASTVGGLIGKAIAYNGMIINSYTEGTVTLINNASTVNLGGLVGIIVGSDNASLFSTAKTAFKIYNSYSSMRIENKEITNPSKPIYVGGLIGSINSYIALNNVYADNSLTNVFNSNPPGAIGGYASTSSVFYTEITNVYWHLDAVFNDANGRISKENMRAFGSGQDTVINDTTLGNKTTKLNNELFRADSSIENALVNQLNLGKPSVSNYPALSWSNQEGSSPYFSDSDTYKVVLKDTYLQLHKNETAQLETQLIPFIAGKNIDIKFSKISGSDSISVNDNGLVSISGNAIAHQGAVIEMQAFENNQMISSDQAEIIVLPDETAAESIIIQDSGLIKAGDTVQLKAVVLPTSAEQNVRWSVKTVSEIASVSSSGLLTAYKAGAITVRAEAGGIIVEKLITIHSGNIWDGSIEEPDNDGVRYYITKPSELAWVADQTNAGLYQGFKNKEILLMNDINLGGHNWIPIGSLYNPFRGTFNGNGKTISNMLINDKIYAQQDLGLFGNAFGSADNPVVIKNFKFINPVIDIQLTLNSATYMGLLCGSIDTFSVSDVVISNGKLMIDDYREGNSTAAFLFGHAGYGFTLINIDAKNIDLKYVTNNRGIKQISGISPHIVMPDGITYNVALTGKITIDNSKGSASFITGGFYSNTNMGSTLVEISNSYFDIDTDFSEPLTFDPIVRNTSRVTCDNVYIHSEHFGKLTPVEDLTGAIEIADDKIIASDKITDSLVNLLNGHIIKMDNKYNYNSWYTSGNEPPGFASPNITSITVNPTSKVVVPGETLQLEKVIVPFTAQDVKVTYTSSHPDVTVDNNGLVKVKDTAVPTFAAVITMTPSDNRYPKSTCLLMVTPKPLDISEIQLEALDTVYVNSIEKVNAYLKPGDADASLLNWSLINDENTNASISSKGTLLTGDNSGTVTVRASSSINPEIYDEVIIQIKDKNISDAWDGSVEMVTPVENVIHIQRPSQLAYIANQVNANLNHYDGIEVILDNDLDFGGRNWTPIAYDSDYYFGGNFNGNGKTINNFLISNLEYRLVGLFGRMKNSVIHDLTFESPIIRGSTTKANNIAIVTGVGEAVEFRNISINNPLLDIDDSVAVNNQTAVLIAGCGMNEGSTIINVDVNNMIINYRTHSSGVKQISGLASNVPDALRLIVNSSVTGKINVVNAGGSATAMISGLIANESFHSTSQNLFNCYTDITIQTNISAYIGSIIGRIATSRSDYILNKNVFAHFDYTYPTYGSYWTVVEHTSPEVFRQENVFFNGNINGAEVESTDRKDEIHADFAQATAPISDPSSVVRQLNEGIKELPELDGITYRTWRLNGLYPELGEPSTVTLNQNSITMKSGETTSLSARVNPISMGTDLYWESENTTIAAVDQSGKITGKTPGTTIIKAMSKDGQIAVCKVKVEAVTTSIILMIEGEDKDTELCVNDYRTITAEMQPIDEQLTWISSNPEVLSIIEDSENNKHIEIYALRHGQATITAESESKVVASIDFIVNNPVTELKIIGSHVMDLSHTEQILEAKMNDDATIKDIRWSIQKKVNDELVETNGALIDQNGKVTIVDTAFDVYYVVTAEALDGSGIKTQFEIHVIEATIDNLQIILPEGKTFLSGEIGKSVELHTKIEPASVSEEEAELIYTSSMPSIFIIDKDLDNKPIVKISQQAKLGDTAQITVTSPLGNEIMDTVWIMIEWTKVESLEIIDRDTGKPLPIDNFYSLGKGTTLKLKAEPTPLSAANPSVVWSVQNLDTVSDPLAVIDENGYLTALKPGKVKVTATSKEDGSIKAEADIDIIEIYPEKIYANEGNQISVNVGMSSLQLNIGFEPESTTNRGLHFTSSDESIATVDSSGKLTFKGKIGETIITVTPEINELSGYQADPLIIEVQVTDKKIYVTEINGIRTAAGAILKGIKEDGSAIEGMAVTVKDQLQLSAIYEPGNATVSASEFLWSLNNADAEDEDVHAEITATGSFKALSSGDVILTVKIKGENNKDIEYKQKIHIEEPTAQSISFSKSALILKPGTDNAQIKAIVDPSDRVSQKVKWSSNDTSVTFLNASGQTISNDEYIEGMVYIKVGNDATAGKQIIITAESMAVNAQGIHCTAQLSGTIAYIEPKLISLAETSSLIAGQNKELSAVVWGETINGVRLKATDQRIKWESSDPSIIAINEAGLMTALKAGTAVITAISTADERIKKTCTVTSTSADLTQIILDQSEILLVKGEQIEVTASGNAGSQLENPTWTLSNSSILSIEENGNQVTLTALKSGNTILKAEKNGVYAECVIRVVLDEVLVESILLHGPETSLEPGNEALITAEVIGVDGKEASNKILRWTSSDPDSVRIMEEEASIGRIKVIKKGGNVKITAAACDGSDVVSEIIISTKDASAQNITLDKKVITLGSKDTTGVELNASILPSDLQNKEVQWKLSKTGIVTYETIGGDLTKIRIKPVSGVVPGESVIVTASINGKEAQCVILISEIKIESVQIAQSSIELIEGYSALLPVKVLPDNTSNTELIWEIYDQSLLKFKELSESDGVEIVKTNSGYTLQAKKLLNGNSETYRLRAKAKADSSIISNELNVTVKKGTLTALKIVGGKVLVKNSSTTSSIQLSVMPTPLDAMTGKLTWQVIREFDSNNQEIISTPDGDGNEIIRDNIIKIDDTGKITAVSVGTAEVQVIAANGISDTITISVLETIQEVPEPVAVTEIEVINIPETLTMGEIALGKVKFYDTLHNEITPLNTEIRWQSDNEAVLKVDQVTGIVTAVSAGTANLHAISNHTIIIHDDELDQDIASAVKATFAVTVKEPNGLVKSLEISPSSTELSFRKSQVLNATAVYTGDINDLTFTWSSTDETIATVTQNQNDPLKAVVNTFDKAGTALIILNINGVNAFVNIKVSAEAKTPVTDITVRDEEGNDIGSRLELYAGSAKKIVAAADSAASNPTLSLISDNEAVATIDEDGIISALAQGLAVITIRPVDSSSSVTRTIVVNVLNIPEYELNLSQENIQLESGMSGNLQVQLHPLITEGQNVQYTWSLYDSEGNSYDGDKLRFTTDAVDQSKIQLKAGVIDSDEDFTLKVKADISGDGIDGIKTIESICLVKVLKAVQEVTAINIKGDSVLVDEDNNKSIILYLIEGKDQATLNTELEVNGLGNPYLNWTSVPSDLLTIQQHETGVVLTAKRSGNAAINVKAVKGIGEDSIHVEIRNVSVITLDAEIVKSNIEIGEETQINCTLETDPLDQSAIEADKLRFTSSNEKVAVVDNTGKVSGISEGIAMITVMSETDPSKYKVFMVNVSKQIPTPILMEKFILTDKNNNTYIGNIDNDNHTITVLLPTFVSKASLIAEFSLSQKGTEVNDAEVRVGDVIQISKETVNNFTNSLTYSIIDSKNAENVTTYTVWALNESVPEEDARITEFKIIDGDNDYLGIINDESYEISIMLPETVNLTKITPIFTVSNEIAVTAQNQVQISGKTQVDFSTGQIVYMLSGKNGHIVSYTVKVDTGPELTSIKLKQGETSLEGQWDIERECYVFTVPALVQIDYDQPFILEWTPDTLTHSGSLNLNLNEMQSVPFIYADQFTRTVPLMIVESKADSLSVSPQTLSLKPGESSTVSALIQPDSASQKVNWTLQPGSEQFLELEMLEGSAVQVKVKADAPVGASAVLIAESEADASLRAEVSVFIIKNNADTVKILGIEDGSSDRPAVLKVHQTLQLSAEVYAGDELATNQHVTWSSSDPTIASVSLDGTINALSTGSAMIQAVSDDGGIKAEIHLRIEPADLSGITIDKTSLLMIKGSHEQLHVLANEGSELGEIHWTSSDPAIVKVDSEGTITALKSGQAVITAKVSEYEASCMVKVVNGDIKITSIDLSSAAAQVEAGQTFLIQADVLPEDAGNKILKWTSSDEALIHVVNKNSSVGVLQVRKGTGTPVMITAEAMDGSGTKASIMITPMPSTISGIDLSSNFIRLGAKDQEGTLLRASLLPITAEGTITWQTDRSDLISLSSNEGASVIVRPQPGVDARNDNYAVVTASSGDVQAQCVVLLSEIAAESITLEPVSMLLNVDEEQKIQVAFTPENATNTILEWQVLDGDGTAVLISRKGSGYTAVGLKAGEVTLQAVNEEGIISNPIHLSVKDEGLSGLQLIGNDVLVLNDEQRSATQLYALAQPASAVIDSLTWRSEDEMIAEVSEEGLVTAVGSGSTEIIASCGAIEASFTIFVYAIEDTPQDIEAEKIRIDTAVTPMQIDDKEYLTVSFDPSDTTNKAVRWESDQPEVIRVEAATGLIEAVGAGEATITVTSLENESIYDTVTITVMERSGITSLSWENEISTLLKGEIGELKAVITGTGEETSFRPVWSSSNPEVITVSAKNDDTASAEIEALAKGTAVIYLMVQDQMITQTITVTETETIPVTTITIDELGNRDYLELSVNESQELTIHVNEDAADKNLTVTSSDETIATVNGTTIEAISEGIAVITIQPSDAASSVVRKIFVKVMPEPEPEVTLDKNSLVIVAGTAGSVSATSILEATYQWSCKDDTVTLTNADEAAVTIQTTTTQVKNVVLTLSVTVNGNEITRECLLTLIPAPSQSDAAEKIEILDDKGQILDLLKLDLTAPQAMLTAHVLPETAVQYVNWTSSDPAIASVQGSNSAIVTAYKTGSVTLTATTLDGKIQASIPCVITNSGKEEVVIRSIKLKAETQELMIGESAELRVSLDPESQIDQVLFTTSKEGILSIEKSSSGVYVMKGLSEGSVDVTVLATKNLSKKDTLRIIVSKAPAQPLLFKEFTLWNEKGEAVSTKTVIDATQKTILVTVPLLHDKRSLVARYTLSGEGKVNVGGIEQQSGVSVNDYQEAVAYEVIDPEGSHTLYTVLVLNETIPSVNGALKTFKLNGVEGEIDEEAKKVIVKLDKREDRSRLIAEFTMSDALELIGPQGVQVSGESENDYRNGQTMTVIGKNGVSVTYQILVDIGPAVQTMTLSQNGKHYSGIIDAQQDTIRFSALKGQADLSAGFTVTAETSALDPQGVSYETTIQFENGTQTLTITDGNGRSYTYTLMFEETEPESELTLTGMKIGGIECKIEGRIIEVILPYGRDLSEALKVEYTSSEPGELMIGETTISNGGSRVFGEEKALEVTVKNDEKSKEYTLIVSQASGSAKIEKVILNGTEAEPNEQNELKFTFAKGTDLSQVRAEFQLSDSRAKVYVDHEETVSGTLIDVSRPRLIVVELDGNKEIYTLQAEIDYGPQFVGQITLTQGDIILTGSIDSETGVIGFDITNKEINFSEPFVFDFKVAEGVSLMMNGEVLESGSPLFFTSLSDIKVLRLEDENGTENAYQLKLYEEMNLPQFETFVLNDPNVTGIVIDHVSGTITIKVKPGTDMSTLKPEFTLNQYAQMVFVGTQVQISGVSVHDFSQGVDYLLIGNGRTKSYRVMAIEDIEGPAVYSFGVQGTDGIIYYGKTDNINREIIVRVPKNMSRDDLVIYYQSSENTILITGLNQEVISGESVRSFKDLAINFKLKDTNTSVSVTFKVNVKYEKDEGDINDDGKVDQQDVIKLASIVNEN